jgi:hypothetical protein
LRLQESLKIGFRGIFGVIRFSTFATISANRRHSKAWHVKKEPVHFVLTVVMAVGIPLTILLIGRAAFWISDQFGRKRKKTFQD